jgi:hypothetical protein
LGIEVEVVVAGSDVGLVVEFAGADGRESVAEDVTGCAGLSLNDFEFDCEVVLAEVTPGLAGPGRGRLRISTPSNFLFVFRN